MEVNSFCLDNYDCIGFDLDSTLAEYNLHELMKLIYNLMVEFLVTRKNYDSQFLMEPFEEGEYLIQRGTFIDFQKGNLLKVDENGCILKGTHGTVSLDEETIIKEYGPEKKFHLGLEFLNNPMLSLNAQRKKKFFGTYDCFNLPCALLFARIVDQMDAKNGKKSDDYNVFQDLLEGLWSLYSINCFASGEGGFFSALKKDPSRYYIKWDEEKIMWLKKLKEKKFVFLITGSYIDFASLTASTCIGENWRDYFDLILCYAKKPYFFTDNHPFHHIIDGDKGDAVSENEMQTKFIYCEGNWKDLNMLLSRETKLNDPKCLYVGDNIIQDVFAPVHAKCCDSVSVLIELKKEFGYSKLWGSFFVDNGSTTYWNKLVKSHAQICISGLDVLCRRPLSFQYTPLTNTDACDPTESNGYYVV